MTILMNIYAPRFFILCLVCEFLYIAMFIYSFKMYIFTLALPKYLLYIISRSDVREKTIFQIQIARSRAYQ